MLKENNYYLTHHKGKNAQIKSSFLRISEKIYNDNFSLARARVG